MRHATPHPVSLIPTATAILIGIALLTVACGIETSDTPFGGEGSEFQSTALSNSTYWCPAGSWYDATYRLCTTPTQALGPFTPAMIETCKRYGGGLEACENAWWDSEFAKSIRGTDRCPPGSSLDAKRGYCTDGNHVYGPFSFALVDRCKRTGGGPACETARWSTAMVPERPDVWCPDGTDYDFDYRLCISASDAIGPFTSPMIQACIDYGGGSQACKGARWDLAFARALRGTGTCPPGSTLDAGKGYCAEGDDLFGPFSPSLVDRCKAGGGGQACETMRWKRVMVPDRAAVGTSNPLSVPYFYQYHNAYEPGSTCGLTSAAMLLKYWGKSVTPDSLYLKYGKAQGQSPGSLANLYRAYGLKATSTYAATDSAIKAHINTGRPVVVHGYFTVSGHVVVLVGYDATGWYVNDPAGKWAGCVGCGYPNRTPTNGKLVHYSYDSVRAAIGTSGTIWMSTADPSSL